MVSSLKHATAGSVGPISFRPNPAPAGGEVEVSFDGKPPLYYQSAGAKGWTEIPLDAKGKGKIRVPRGIRILVFTDKEQPPTSAEVLIVDPGR